MTPRFKRARETLFRFESRLFTGRLEEVVEEVIEVEDVGREGRGGGEEGGGGEGEVIVAF
jgi:hypothetical protein